MLDFLSSSPYFNWAVCASLMLSPSTEHYYSTLKEKMHFLRNLFEYNLHHHISSNNTTEIDRFLRVDISSDGKSPASNILSLLFDAFVHQEKDLLPLGLALHFMDTGYNLTFVSPLKENENEMDEDGSTRPAVFDFPSSDLDELVQSYHNATGVKRLEFRLFAYQLQICKMEWQSLGSSLEGSVTDTSALSRALDLPSLQYLMTFLSEKNVMGSLMDNMYDFSREKGKDMDLAVGKEQEGRRVQDPFVYQLKVARVYALLLVSFPVPSFRSLRALDEEGEQRNQGHSFKAPTGNHRHCSQVDVLDALAFSRPHISLVTHIWEIIKTTPNVFPIFESISRLSADERQLHHLGHADMEAAKNRLGVNSEFLVDGMYCLLMLFFRLGSLAFL